MTKSDKGKEGFSIRSRPPESGERDPVFIPQQNIPKYPNSPSVGNLGFNNPAYQVQGNLPPYQNYPAPPPPPPPSFPPPSPRLSPEQLAYHDLENRIVERKREIYRDISNSGNYDIRIRRKFLSQSIANTIKSLDPQNRYFTSLSTDADGNLICISRNKNKFLISLNEENLSVVSVTDSEGNSIYECKYNPEELLDPNNDSIIDLFVIASWEV